MNRKPLRLHHPAPRHRTAPALLAALGLLAWLAPPLEAEVIDDFSGPKKFILGGFIGDPEYNMLDGQFHLSLPTPGSFAAFAYLPTYELPEGQPVEFKVDVVSLDRPQVYAGLSVGFLQPRSVPRRSVRGYGLFWLQDQVVLAKSWDTSEVIFLDTSLAYSPEPVTVSLTLTRHGPSLKLDVKVVRRDEPEHVVFARSVTDGTGVDVAGDNGAPPSGPVWAVWMRVGTVDGSAPGEAVFDNLLCSTDPVPVRLGIQHNASGDVRLEWSSGYSMLLEANGLAGPWYPWPGIPSAASGAYRASIPCSEPGKFFRLASGEQWLDEFDTVWSAHSWKFASPVPGETSVPMFSRPNGQGRVRWPADRSADFVMYWSMGFGEYRRCFASVDIVDWDETMEDAAFGIVLRANPGKDLWLPAADGLPHNRYLGLLTFKKAGSPSESVLSLSGPGGEVLKTQTFPAVDPARQYRLRFWAVGDQLTLELFDLENLDVPIRTCEATDARVPAGLDALYGTKSATGTYDVTIDRYQLTGEYW